MEEGEPIDNPDDASEADDLLELENADTQSETSLEDDPVPLELQRPPRARGRGRPALRGRGSRSAPPAQTIYEDDDNYYGRDNTQWVAEKSSV